MESFRLNFYFSLDEEGPDYLYYLARAIADYKPQTETELAFTKNDILEIYERDPSGWWKGRLNGKLGWVPAGLYYLLDMFITVGRFYCAIRRSILR